MQSILPIAEAVLAGAVDSVENFAINVRDHLPLLKRLQQKQQKHVCLDGKVAIVTGANAGIGYATARKLAERGAHVVLACRSRERGQAAAQELSAVPPLPGCRPGSVEFSPLDLSSLASVRRFAAAFNRGGRPLDVLVCNAGIMSPPQRLVSEDGLELQFQVNFLSHWLLAHELLAEQRGRRAKAARGRPPRTTTPCTCGNTSSSSTSTSSSSSTSTSGSSKGADGQLGSGTATSGGRGGHAPCCCCCGGGGSGGTRLVLLSSLTHPAGQVKWGDKQSLASYSPFTSYALSKLCNTMMAAEFQRRFDAAAAADAAGSSTAKGGASRGTRGSGGGSACGGACCPANPYGHDSAVAIHPGIVATSLATGFFSQTGASALPGLQAVVQPVLSALFPLLLRTPDSSADSMLLAVTAPADQVAGRYLHNSRLARPTRFAEDPLRGRELWDLAVELTGTPTHTSLAEE